MSKQPGKHGHKISRPALIISIGMIGLLLVVGIWGVLSGTFRGVLAGQSSQSSPHGVAISNNVPVSPLLFGTNMGLFSSNDQVLKSSTARTLLQQIHAQIIRMPVRSSLSEATEVQAAQIIKSIGAVPLVVLRGAVDSNVLADDSLIVNDMNRIFGNSVVYYEYGNEEDLLGVGATRYTASWNAVIPKLKSIALHGQFVGPVNFQWDSAYLTTFLQSANPRPDQVSWHEYTCDDSWAKDICISHIANWTRHITQARAVMTATIGTTLPIMITEFNYAPNAVQNDGKNNDPVFMTTWTTIALQTLAANRIFAAMQYSCTDTAIPLISSGDTLTVQGAVFKGQYLQMIAGGQQPTPAPTSPAGTSPAKVQPTPTSGISGKLPAGAPVTLNYKPVYSFEDGNVSEWDIHSHQITNVQASTNIALDGKYSMQVTLSGLDGGSYPYLSLGRSGMTSFPHAGQTISMYVYVPGNTTSLTAKVFVMDSSYHWFSTTMTALTPGTWNRITYTLPSNVGDPLYQLGIQFGTLSNTPVSSDVYIDAIGWF